MSDKGYTPTTEMVRDAYSFAGDDYYGADVFDAACAAEFDRWLADHDREVAARAWDEGYGDDLEANTPRKNPYRKGEA